MNIILCSEFDIKKLSFTEIDFNNPYNKKQGISFPNYDNKHLIIQTSTIQILKLGIPKLSEYYNTDQTRFFIKLYMDPNQKNCKKLEDVLNSIDEYIINHKDSILGKYNNNVEFCPTIRKMTDDSYAFIDDNIIRPREEIKYCKLKFRLSPINKLNETSIFIKENGSIKKMELKRLEEIEKYFRYYCYFRAIIHINKLWITKTRNDKGLREFGLSLKLLSLEITPFKKQRLHEIFQEYRFIEDHDDSK